MNTNKYSVVTGPVVPVVIGYLGGCFGNCLATVLRSSLIDKVTDPNERNFHVKEWSYNLDQCMITYDSQLTLLRDLEPGEILQVHCLNGCILTTKFPKSKNILLTCDAKTEIYAIHRQWSILNDLTSPRLEMVISAWDWITFNLGHYNNTGRNLDHDAKNLLNLDFLEVPAKWSVIEDFLQIKIAHKYRDMLTNHYDKQMMKFYQCHEYFEFAWQIYRDKGPDAPIEDLARKHFEAPSQRSR